MADILDLILKKKPDWIHLLDEEGRTPLHWAACIGYLEGVRFLLGRNASIATERDKNGLFPIHVASAKGHVHLIQELLQYWPNSRELLNHNGQNILHVAATTGELNVVNYILKTPGLESLINDTDKDGNTPIYLNASIATERDKNGLFPIHVASTKGHVHLIQELLQYWPNSRELLNHNGQNILHVAATTGELNVVNYILKTPGLESLINDTDKDGNTPLHLATMHWHAKLVSAFTWDKKVDLTLINSEGLTALDIAECSIGNTFTFRQRLTLIPLRAAGVPRNPSANTRRQFSTRLEAQKTDICKDKVNTLLLVSTVVATVTFAAGFSIPGGYNSSGEDSGTATLITHKFFHVFIFCDTIAMYTSVVVAVTLIWAQLGDVHLVLIALKTASPLLGVALATMSLAFLAAVYLVVSTLNWLANVIMIMGLVFLVALIARYFFLWFPMSSSCLILRYVSYYPFCLLVLVAGSGELVV
ncbi:protein ACCELERATED CELL DEATH 6 [Quercus suber]|uniref:Protein accelerated cell death 6 n=1 Tax=Quercus suber TaxID=58331 RepID=A0AAW0KZQ3_QUESU